MNRPYTWLGERHLAVLVRGSEDVMARPRAADDFKAIRARMEELRREKARPEPVLTDRGAAGHRGPCACGLSLFSDECDGCCKAL